MEALQNLGLLDHQGIIRCARYIELEQADLDALKKSIRFFEAAMPQFDEQGRSLLTAMSSLCSRLACEVIIVTPRSAEVADKKAEGGHTEQANCDRMMILNLVPTKLSEVISKNESKLDKAMVDGTRIDSSPANRKLLQPENIKAVSESGFKMDGLTKDDKMLSKMESNTGGNVEAKAKEAATVFIFMEPNTAACTNLASICWNKLIKVLSSCTKFAFRAMKVVASFFHVIFSPFSMPPSPVPKRRIRRLGPLSPSRMEKRSNLTESKEWGLPPKKSPPSCLPAC